MNRKDNLEYLERTRKRLALCIVNGVVSIIVVFVNEPYAWISLLCMLISFILIAIMLVEHFWWVIRNDEY